MQERCGNTKQEEFHQTPQSKFRKITNPELRIYGKLSHLSLPLVCESYLCSVVVVVVWRRRKRTYAEATTAKQESMRERERDVKKKNVLRL